MDSSLSSKSSSSPTSSSCRDHDPTKSDIVILRVCKWCKSVYDSKRKLKAHKRKRHPELQEAEKRKKMESKLQEMCKSKGNNNGNAKLSVYDSIYHSSEEEIDRIYPENKTEASSFAPVPNAADSTTREGPNQRSKRKQQPSPVERWETKYERLNKATLNFKRKRTGSSGIHLQAPKQDLKLGTSDVVPEVPTNNTFATGSNQEIETNMFDLIKTRVKQGPKKALQRTKPTFVSTNRIFEQSQSLNVMSQSLNVTQLKEKIPELLRKEVSVKIVKSPITELELASRLSKESIAASKSNQAQVVPQVDNNHSHEREIQQSHNSIPASATTSNKLKPKSEHCCPYCPFIGKTALGLKYHIGYKQANAKTHGHGHQVAASDSLASSSSNKTSRVSEESDENTYSNEGLANSNEEDDSKDADFDDGTDVNENEHNLSEGEGTSYDCNVEPHIDPITNKLCKKCPVCNQSLGFESNIEKRRYREHVDIHRGLRPFLCPFFNECCRSFTNPVDLLSHTSFSHTNDDAFECDKCLKSFKLKRLFSQHVKRCKS